MVDPVSPAPPQLACRVRPSTVASAIQTQAEFDVRAASSAIADDDAIDTGQRQRAFHIAGAEFNNHGPDGRDEAGWMMPGNDSEAVAEFIRTKGITRCPTACVLPTQGSVAAADRVACAGPFTPSTSRCSPATIFKLQGPTHNIAGLTIRAAVHLRARAASAWQRAAWRAGQRGP